MAGIQIRPTVTGVLEAFHADEIQRADEAGDVQEAALQATAHRIAGAGRVPVIVSSRQIETFCETVAGYARDGVDPFRVMRELGNALGIAVVPRALTVAVPTVDRSAHVIETQCGLTRADFDDYETALCPDGGARDEHPADERFYSVPLDDGQLGAGILGVDTVGVVDEREGGIVLYCHASRADSIVRALNGGEL